MYRGGVVCTVRKCFLVLQKNQPHRIEDFIFIIAIRKVAEKAS